MAILTTAPRGTKDILPADTSRWRQMEALLLNTGERYGFQEIRVPTFEHTELFSRSVGENTDVVSKEMYTFTDKGGRSVTLRPEGTAGLARAAIENGLLADALPLKLSYLVSCFRYEKPQSGRFREFHQFGIEMYGASAPEADAEVIAVAHRVFERFGLTGIRLELNSIGCRECRPAYHRALTDYFTAHKEALCPTCLERLQKNPMRIIDCKNPDCQKIAEGAPYILDYLCGDCREHFGQVQQLLTAAGIDFAVNPGIVRGLDYYTRTVFEFVCDQPQGQPLVCGGGGRYGGLLEELGGPAMEGIGFAMGLERLLLILEQQHYPFAASTGCDLFLVAMDAAARQSAFAMAERLRAAGCACQCDLMGRSLKAQMKYANKTGAAAVIVLGEQELATGEGQLKRMATGETVSVPLDAGLAGAVLGLLRAWKEPQ